MIIQKKHLEREESENGRKRSKIREWQVEKLQKENKEKGKRDREKSKELTLKESFRDNLKYGELKVCKNHLEIYLQLPVAS